MDKEKLVELAKLLGWELDYQDVEDVYRITNTKGSPSHSWQNNEASAWYNLERWLRTGDGMLAVMKRLAELLGENSWLQVTQLRCGVWSAIVWDGEGQPWDKCIIARIEHKDPPTAVALAAYEVLKHKEGDTH